MLKLFVARPERHWLTGKKGPDINTKIASMEHGSDAASESFLGMRPDPPPPPDPEPGSHEPPDFEVRQHSERSQGHPSGVVISESQPSPGSITSPTRVPVHFKRPPPITPLTRSSSQSPQSSSRSMSEVVPQIKARPRSMELKKFSSSKEIRPLWLVERHQSHQEPSTTTPTAASFVKKTDQSEHLPPILNDTPETEQGAELTETPKPRKYLSRNEIVEEMVTAATNADEHPEEDRQIKDSKRQMPLFDPESGFAFRDPFADEHPQDDSDSMPKEEGLSTADLRQPETALVPVISPFDQAVDTEDKSDPVEPGHDAEFQREEEAANVGKDPSIESFIDSSIDSPESTQSPVKIDEAISVIQEPDGKDKDENLQFTAERESKRGKWTRSSTPEEPSITTVPQQDTTTGGREQPEESEEASLRDASAEIPEDDTFGFVTKKKRKKGGKSRQSITEKPLEPVPSKEGTIANFSEAPDSPQQQDVEAAAPPTTAGIPEDGLVKSTKKKKGKKGQKGRQTIIEEPIAPALPQDDTTLDVAKAFHTPEEQAPGTPVRPAPVETPFVAESPLEDTALDVGETPEVQKQQAIEKSVQPVTSEAFEDEDDTFQSTTKKKGKKGKEGRVSVYEPQTEFSAPDATAGLIAEELDDQADLPALATSKKKDRKGKKQNGRSQDLEGTETPGAPFSTIETNETPETGNSEVIAPEEPPNQPVIHDVKEPDRSLDVEVEEAAHSDAHQNAGSDISQDQMPKIPAETRDLTIFAGDKSAELEDDLSLAKIQNSEKLMEDKDRDASNDESMEELEKLEGGEKSEDQPEQVTEPAFAASILGRPTDIADLQPASPDPENINSHEINAALTQNPEYGASQSATASALESDASQSPAAIRIEKTPREDDSSIEDLTEPDRNVYLGPATDDAQTPEIMIPQDAVTLGPTEIDPSQLPLSSEMGHVITPSAEQDDIREPQTENIDEAQFAPKKNRKEKKRAKKAKAAALYPEFDPIPGPAAPESTEVETADLAPLISTTKDKDEGQFKETLSGERLPEAEPAKTQNFELRPPPTQEDEQLENNEAPSGSPTAEATSTVANTVDLDKSDPNAAAEDVNNDFKPLKTKKDKKKKRKSSASEVAQEQDTNETELSLVPPLDRENANIVSGQHGLQEVASSSPGPISQTETEPVEEFLKRKGKKSKKKNKKLVPFALDDVPEMEAGGDESVSYGEEVPLVQAAARMENIPAEADFTESKDLEPDEQLPQPHDAPAISEMQETRPPATDDPNVSEISPQADGETLSRVYEHQASKVLGTEPRDEHSEHHPADDLLPSYPSETHEDDFNPEPSEAASINKATPAPLEEHAESPAETQGSALVPEVAVPAEGEAIDEALPLTTKAAKKDKKKSRKRQSVSWNDEPTEPPSEAVKEPVSPDTVVEREITTEAQLPASLPDSTPAADFEAIDKGFSLTKKSTKEGKKAKNRRSLAEDEDLTTEPPAEVVTEPSEGPESMRSFMEDEASPEPQEPAPDPNPPMSMAVEAMDKASPLTKEATSNKKKEKKRQALSWDEEPLTEPTVAGAEVVDEALKEPESTRSAIEPEPTTELQEPAAVPDTTVSAEVAAIDEASSLGKRPTKDKKKAKKRQTLSWDEEPIVAPPAETAEILEAPKESDPSQSIAENETIAERPGSAPIAGTPELPEVEPIDEALPTMKKAKKDKKKAKKNQPFSWGEEPTDPRAEGTEESELLHRDVEIGPLRSRSPDSEPKMEQDQGNLYVPGREIATSDTVEPLAATEPTKGAEPEAVMPTEPFIESAISPGLDPEITNDVPPMAIDEPVVESTGQDSSREQHHEQGPVNESRDVDLAPLEIQGPQDEKSSNRSQDLPVAEHVLEGEESSIFDDRSPAVSQVSEPCQLPAEELQRDGQTSRADEAEMTEDLGRPLGANRSNDSPDEPGEQPLPSKGVFEDDRIPSKDRVQAFTDNILASQAAETGDVRETGLAAPATMEELPEAPAEQLSISGPPTPLSAGSADLLNVEEQREYDAQYARELERQLQGQMPDQTVGQETQAPEGHQSGYEPSIPIEPSPHEPRETLAKATSLEDIVEEPLSRSMSQPEKPETQGTQESPFQPPKRSKKGKKGKRIQQPVVWEDETATAGISPEPEPAVEDPDIDDRPLDLEENIETGEAYHTQANPRMAVLQSPVRSSSQAEGDNGDYFGIQPSHPAEEDVGGTGDGDRRHSLSVEPAQIAEERNDRETGPRGIPEENPAEQGAVDDGAPVPSKKGKRGKKFRKVSEIEEKDIEGVREGDCSLFSATEPSQLTQEPEIPVAESRDVPLEAPNEQEQNDEWHPPSKKGKKGKKSRKAVQANEDDFAGTVGKERSQVLSPEPAPQSVQESMSPSRDVQADPPNDPPADNREPLGTERSKKGNNSGDASIAEVVEEMPETAQPQRRNSGTGNSDDILPISQEIARSTEATGDVEMEATEERADDAWESLLTRKDKKGKKSRKAFKAEAGPGAPKIDEMVEIERPQTYGDAQKDLDVQGTAITQEETEPIDKQAEADDWTPLSAKRGKKGKKSRNGSKAETGLPKVDETREAERAEQHDGQGESDAQVLAPQEAAENFRGLGDVAAAASLGAAALATEGLFRENSKDKQKDNKRSEEVAPVEDSVTTSRDLETTEQLPSNKDLSQIDEQQDDPTSQHQAESALLPESVQAEQIEQNPSIDVDDQRQRDSAIHVQMSPSLPEEDVHRVERDSGYPATEPSPTLKEQQESKEEPTERDIIESYNQPRSPHIEIEQDWAPSETSGPANEEQDSKAGFTEGHASDPYNEKYEDNEADLIESYGEALEGDHSDPLITRQHGQAETEEKVHSEASIRSSTSPIKTPGVKAKRRKSRRASGAAYDSDDSADSGFDVQKRRRRIQALAEEPREPSPVSSTTKDRSSALFDSSPSGRDVPMEELRDRSPVGAQPSAASPKDAQMQHARPEDSPSEPRNPIQMVERGRQGLRRVSDRSTEQSPRSPLSRKDKRDVSDIGTPEQGVKTRRKSRKFPRREGTPSSGGEDLRSQSSLPASDDRASSIGFQESIGRNTDRVPSRLSNISGARSLRSPGIGSPDSIHAIIRTPEQVRSASGQSIRSSGTPPLRRVDRSISGDLRAASRKNEAKIDTKPKIAEEAEPEEAIRHQLSFQQLPQQLHQDQESDEDIPIASSSGYDPVKDKGKTRADPDMADYVSAL